MKYVVIALALAVSACAQEQPAVPPGGSLAVTYELYKQCLAAMPPEQCETPRARFEAARGYADSVSRGDAARVAARPPVVFLPAPVPLPTAIPAPRQPINCVTNGNITSCY